MKMKSAVYFIITVFISLGIVLLLLKQDEHKAMRELENQARANGLEVAEIGIDKGRIALTVSTGTSGKKPEDLLLARYLQNTALFPLGTRGVSVTLENSEGETLYSATSTEKEPQKESGIFPSESAYLLESALVKTKLQYAFNQQNISCGAIKLTEYPQIYVKKKTIGRTVNIVLTGSAETLPELLSKVEEIIAAVNKEGAVILQYNLQISDAEGTVLFLGSFDLLTNDSVVLQ